MRDENRNLSSEDKKLIRNYVIEVIRKEFRTIRKYYDVDKGLDLRPEVVKRLNTGRKCRRLSREEFWKRALK